MTAMTDKRHLARWRNAVIVAFALGGITSATVGPRMPSLRADLGVDNAVIGAMLAGVTVGAFVGLACSSALLSWLGARGGIRGALWLVALSVVLIGVGAGVAHALLIVSVGFFLVGLGVGALDIMINVEGAAVERETGRTVMPLMHAAWSSGAVIGAGVGAGCAALNISIPWQFAGEAVLIAVSAPILTAVIPRTPPPPTTAQPRRKPAPVGTRLGRRAAAPHRRCHAGGRAWRRIRQQLAHAGRAGWSPSSRGCRGGVLRGVRRRGNHHTRLRR